MRRAKKEKKSTYTGENAHQKPNSSINHACEEESNDFSNENMLFAEEVAVLGEINHSGISQQH